MGKNNDDKPSGSESFDFAPDKSAKMGGPVDPRFGKTSPDPMRVQRGNTGSAPHLANSRNIESDNLSDPPDPYAENLTGLHVAQNYEILEKVGEGGMSAVYRARHMHLNREVAVKMLHPHLVSNRVSRERFSQEARAVSQIEHHNVVRLLDFGITEENRPYIVMDFLRGGSLSQWIRTKGPLDIRTAIAIFMQICDALAYTHDKGIVHRDLKPSNIILIEKRGSVRSEDDDGPVLEAKIVDFGIAKLSPHEDAGMAALTQTGDVFGSPLYMSPEQAKGEKLDSRADIYSMGCLMYESLTGTPPINGTNMLEILYRHMNEMPAPMNTVAKERNIPRNLEAIVFKALAKDPKDRYQDMRSLAKDLSKFSNTGEGFVASLASAWSLYRSRRKRLIMREKIALVVTSLAIGGLLFSGAAFAFFYFKGTQDFSVDKNIDWLRANHQNKIQGYYDPQSRIVTFSLRGAESRLEDMRKLREKGQEIVPSDSDYEAVMSLMRNVVELKSRGNLDEANDMVDKAIELSSYVHGATSLPTRQAMILKLMIIYTDKKWDQCVKLIETLQRDVSAHTLYRQSYFKALLYSILGESNFHLKNYEKARSDLMEGLTNWEDADKSKEHLDQAIIEVRALATSYFADCFALDKMWEESIKYYKKAEERWQQAEQPVSDYNRALALYKQSLAYGHLNDAKNEEKTFNQALKLLHGHPKDFLFYQTEIEMMQTSASIDQEHGNWMAAAEKFIRAGLAKNRSNSNAETADDSTAGSGGK
ncbi:MAG: protein kinase [Cyanobacteria bacterium SZAS LIN-2]|nr:protein kinase [Cyanobacteria bacterium SZAS LIN-2]